MKSNEKTNWSWEKSQPKWFQLIGKIFFRKPANSKRIFSKSDSGKSWIIHLIYDFYRLFCAKFLTEKNNGATLNITYFSIIGHLIFKIVSF